MPAIELLALDVDGTLVTGEADIAPRTRAALQQAHRAGMRIVLSTGRRYSRAKLVLEAVCLSGALVKDAHGRTLWSARFTPKDYGAVARFIRAQGQVVVGQRDESVNGGPEFLVDDAVPWDEWTAEYFQFNSASAQRRANLPDDPRGDILELQAIGPREAMQRLEGKLHLRWPDLLRTHVLHSPRYRGWFCEVLLVGASKWNGVRWLAERHGIPVEAICAVGDDLNDLPMIREAGQGVAMGNALDEVKAAADHVTGSLDEDGLAAVVERILNGSSLGL